MLGKGGGQKLRAYVCGFTCYRSRGNSGHLGIPVYYSLKLGPQCSSWGGGGGEGAPPPPPPRWPLKKDNLCAKDKDGWRTTALCSEFDIELT